jgi:hypothetical protein
LLIDPGLGERITGSTGNRDQPQRCQGQGKLSGEGKESDPEEGYSFRNAQSPGDRSLIGEGDASVSYLNSSNVGESNTDLYNAK